ncbi:hypothetical protein [Actinoplanes sichuanensis]|uniref:DUF4386 domain-containing protein n=1 Tax=Actinoplanes sichuanensis TaxID=512349 RepID=A0ABW4AQK5_9ACTN|nr:hypothetical protein [Actinoplanes sichuanensis]
MTRLPLVAAPLAMTAYGITRIIGRLDGEYGPGADWQIAHLLGLTGMILFIPVILTLRRHITTGRNLITAITLLGLTTTVIQFTADMLLALAATDRDSLRRLQHQLTDIPGIQAAIYDIGPLLFFLGIVAMAALAARTRNLPWWSPATMLIAVLLPTIDLNLMPLTGLLMLAALHPLHTTTRTRQTTPTPVG